MENQLRYAEKQIHVSLSDNDQFWRINITNDGPPIPQKDLYQIFKSLYKGDNGNFGLGLTISQKIIEYYQGTIQVRNNNEKVSFTINYPKAKH